MDFIQQHGFQNSEADPCLFFRARGTEKTFLAIWVDDGIIASNQQEAIDGFLTSLKEKFQLRSHPLQRYVGIIPYTATEDRRKFTSLNRNTLPKLWRNSRWYPALPNQFQLTRMFI